MVNYCERQALHAVADDRIIPCCLKVNFLYNPPLIKSPMFLGEIMQSREIMHETNMV